MNSSAMFFYHVLREFGHVPSKGPSSGVTSGGRENYTSFYTKNIKASCDKK